MYEGTRESFYIDELRGALSEYSKLNKELRKISEERKKKIRFIKNVLSILKMHCGESELMDLIDKHGLGEQVKPFLTISKIYTAGTATVIRKRKGEKTIVDPATVVQKGTRVRILSGTYQGMDGYVTYSHAKSGKKGLDVIYFITVEGPDGVKHRTSVKHGTINKTWEVIQG